jgi:endonuclease-3
MINTIANSDAKGAYAILIRLKRAQQITIGRKDLKLAVGYYVYAGSAQGGLRGRLNRHINGPHSGHWHIDKLLDAGDVIDVQMVFTTEKSAECDLAAAFAAAPGAVPITGFGASDCACQTHLHYFKKRPGISVRAHAFLPFLEPVYKFLQSQYVDHALADRDPFQTLIKCVLSLRTQDPVTDAAAERLFSVVPDVTALAEAVPNDVAKLIYPVGMYRQKAQRIVEIADQLLASHSGKVPEEIEAMIALPGVGRKTANLVRSFAFHKPAMCVDTHVHRITNRWGLVRTATPDETEVVLRRVLPQDFWNRTNALLVQHGQQVCRPLKPHCEKCALRSFCLYDDLCQEHLVRDAIENAPDHPCLTFRK